MTAARDAAGQAPDSVETAALPVTGSVSWGAPLGTPEPASLPADPPPALSLAPSLAAALPRIEPSPDGLLPDESPPTGLSDDQLAAEQQLIARRYPHGVTESTTVLPAIPAASVTPEVPSPSATSARGTSERHHPVAITCPECSAPAMVELTRRDAVDFCPRCDFPLFWARDQVLLGDPMDSSDDALRRLPGTLGRVVIASTPCPHCTEPNLPTATLCARCGLTMQASLPPTPPQRAVRLPEPVMAPLEDEPRRWWIWLLVVLTVLLVAGIILLAAQPWN